MNTQPFDHFQNVKDRVKFEEQGWIFEISAYFSKVRKINEEYLLDYEHKFPHYPVREVKDVQYLINLNMAVEAIKKALTP